MAKAKQTLAGEIPKRRAPNGKALREDLPEKKPEKSKIKFKLADEPGSAAAETIILIPISNIQPSPLEPQARRRARFKPEEIETLGDSIVRHGLRQPILVRPSEKQEHKNRQRVYEIVFGERRFLAAKAKGISEIKCFVENLSDAEVIELQYEENHELDGRNAARRKTAGETEVLRKAGMRTFDRGGRRRWHTARRANLHLQ